MPAVDGLRPAQSSWRASTTGAMAAGDYKSKVVDYDFSFEGPFGAYDVNQLQNEADQAIQELASDPERVRAMGFNARRTIEERRYYWLDNARRAVELVGLGDRLQEPSASQGQSDSLVIS